jgi:DNA-binding NarL/FixJ family response regulator
MPMALLIVDDDLDFRRVARELLALRGYEVVGEAGSVEEARVAVVAKPPDGILLDVNLPDGEGIELAAELAVTHPGVRVLLTSTNPAASPAGLSERVGSAGFVSKTALAGADLSAYFDGSAGADE